MSGPLPLVGPTRTEALRRLAEASPAPKPRGAQGEPAPRGLSDRLRAMFEAEGETIIVRRLGWAAGETRHDRAGPRGARRRDEGRVSILRALDVLLVFCAALDAGLPADALGELYGAADAAVEELESERGPEDEGAAWLRAELRHLEAKMPRDLSALQAILAQGPRP